MRVCRSVLTLTSLSLRSAVRCSSRSSFRGHVSVGDGVEWFVLGNGGVGEKKKSKWKKFRVGQIVRLVDIHISSQT